jgi:hypothetical protein
MARGPVVAQMPPQTLWSVILTNGRQLVTEEKECKCVAVQVKVKDTLARGCSRAISPQSLPKSPMLLVPRGLVLTELQHKQTASIFASEASVTLH